MLAVGAAEEVLLRSASGGDDDVGARRLQRVELVKGDDGGGEAGALEFGDDGLGTGLGAVGDEDAGRAVLDEVADGELGHLAGADEQDGFVGERTEDLAGEIDRDRGDGDRGGADLGLGADFFCDGEGALEEGVELAALGALAADGSDLAGDGVGLLDLAEDLGLADDHGVQRGGHAEEVTDGLALAELVEVRLDGGGGDGEVLVEEAEEI